jgi:hypothetical protein
VSSGALRIGERNRLGTPTGLKWPFGISSRYLGLISSIGMSISVVCLSEFMIVFSNQDLYTSSLCKAWVCASDVMCEDNSLLEVNVELRTGHGIEHTIAI